MAMLAMSVHGTVMPPWTMSRSTAAAGRSKLSTSARPPSMVSPRKKTYQKLAPRLTRCLRNCSVASSSSKEYGICSSIAAAPSRHRLHQVPITIGWMTMNRMLTAPKGTIIRPKASTSHGMVRQRRRSPMTPVRISRM